MKNSRLVNVSSDRLSMFRLKIPNLFRWVIHCGALAREKQQINLIFNVSALRAAREAQGEDRKTRETSARLSPPEVCTRGENVQWNIAERSSSSGRNRRVGGRQGTGQTPATAAAGHRGTSQSEQDGPAAPSSQNAVIAPRTQHPVTLFSRPARTLRLGYSRAAAGRLRRNTTPQPATNRNDNYDKT